jgi:transposase-like protein
MEQKFEKQFEFSDAQRDRMVGLVLYQGWSTKRVADKFHLPNAYMLSNWVREQKKKLERGAVPLPKMQPRKQKDTKELKQQIKQLEKALEKANVMIYGLNSMIDYAEQELKVPLRKKLGTRQLR